MIRKKVCLAVRHVAFEDLGLLGPLVVSRGYEVRFHDAGIDPFDSSTLQSPDLVVVLGGPIGVYEGNAYPFIAGEVAAIAGRIADEKPILGICLGAQMMAAAFGRAGRAGSGEGDRLGAAHIDRGRQQIRAGAARRNAGAASARRQLRIARGLSGVGVNGALSGAGLCAFAVAACLAISLGDRTGALRKLARRPYRRARQGGHRSERATQAGASFWWRNA